MTDTLLRLQVPARDDADDLLDIFDDWPQTGANRPATGTYIMVPPGHSGPLTAKEYERYLRGEALEHRAGLLSVELPDGRSITARVAPQLWREVTTCMHAVDPPLGRDDERQTVAIFFNLPMSYIGQMTYAGGHVGRGVVHNRVDQAWLYAFFCVACRMVQGFADHFRTGYAALEAWAEQCSDPAQEFLAAYQAPVEVEGCQVFELGAFAEPRVDAPAAGLRVYVTCTDGATFKRFKWATMSAIYAERPKN